MSLKETLVKLFQPGEVVSRHNFDRLEARRKELEIKASGSSAHQKAAQEEQKMRDKAHVLAVLEDDERVFRREEQLYYTKVELADKNYWIWYYALKDFISSLEEQAKKIRAAFGASSEERASLFPD